MPLAGQSRVACGIITAIMKSRSICIALLALAVQVSPTTAQQVRIPDYETARHLFWSRLYPAGGETLYCGRKWRDDRRGLNIEHVFPMSWVTRALRCGRRKQCRDRSPLFNRIEADLHNLYPSWRVINDARSSYRFGEIAGELRYFGKCDFEVDEQNRVVEPRPAVRGEIARAMFYMQRAYGMVIYRRQAAMLLDWHRTDPPSDEERRRNDVIEKLQGNRNPFIDHPEMLPVAATR